MSSDKKEEVKEKEELIGKPEYIELARKRIGI